MQKHRQSSSRHRPQRRSSRLENTTRPDLPAPASTPTNKRSFFRPHLTDRAITVGFVLVVALTCTALFAGAWLVGNAFMPEGDHPRISPPPTSHGPEFVAPAPELLPAFTETSLT